MNPASCDPSVSRAVFRVLPFMLILAGCLRTPGENIVHSNRQWSESDESAVRDVVRAYVDAWNQHE